MESYQKINELKKKLNKEIITIDDIVKYIIDTLKLYNFSESILYLHIEGELIWEFNSSNEINYQSDKVINNIFKLLFTKNEIKNMKKIDI